MAYLAALQDVAQPPAYLAALQDGAQPPALRATPFQGRGHDSELAGRGLQLCDAENIDIGWFQRPVVRNTF